MPAAATIVAKKREKKNSTHSVPPPRTTTTTTTDCGICFLLASLNILFNRSRPSLVADRTLPFRFAIKWERRRRRRRSDKMLKAFGDEEEGKIASFQLNIPKGFPLISSSFYFFKLNRSIGH